MAKLIEFYIPPTFTPPKAPFVPLEQRGKVIEFRSIAAKSA